MNEQKNESEQLTPSSDFMKKSDRRPTFILVGVLLIIGIFRLGYQAGDSGLRFSFKDFKIIYQQSTNTNYQDYSLLWQALEVVNRKYIDKDQVDQQKVLYGAISGAVAAAGDEYTEFFSPEVLAEFQTELKGSFGGIGAEIGRRNGNIVIIAPLDDTPAKKAGLLSKDIIVKVDDAEVFEWTLDKTVSKIRGPEGSSVKLTIFREGRSSTFDVTIVRAKIHNKSVKVAYQVVEGKDVAIIKLSRFGDDTIRLLDEAILDIKSRGISYLVLDLRNNPGGYLDKSVEVASDWLEKGLEVVKESHSEKETVSYKSSGKYRLGGLNTVVIINGGSASASEILAGALRDHSKAILIGEKSFGKGSVQELIPLNQNTAVKVTIAKWITPSGQNLNKDGLIPDIEIKLTESDINADLDPQLNKALSEVVRKK